MNARPPHGIRKGAMQPEIDFQQCKTSVAEQREQAGQRESLYSWARLAFFATPILIWLLFLRPFPLIGIAITLLFILAFAWAVRKHLVALAVCRQLDREMLMIEEAVQRVGGKVACIRDWRRPSTPEAVSALPALESGNERVWSFTHQEVGDLDYYAEPVGIFGLLNRTSTELGASRLRDMLENPLLDANAIRARQGAVRRLAEEVPPRVRLMGAIAQLRKEDRRLSAFVGAVAGAKPFVFPLNRAVLRGWAVFSGALWAAALPFVLTGSFVWGWIPMIAFAINFILLRNVRQSLHTSLDPWREVGDAPKALLAISKTLREMPEESLLSPELSGRLRALAEDECLKPICRWVGWTESGGAMYALLNHIALIDPQLAYNLADTAATQRERILLGIAALREAEALCALACFAHEQGSTTWPEISVQKEFVIRNGKHPLLQTARAVPNSLSLNDQERVWIITGSNMAGKSTFLRMACVQSVLAQIGTAVPAESCRLTPLRLITDLRAADSLAREESYFLAEVRHLRRLMSAPAGEEPVFGVIDEPFRGTNSLDQTAASQAVLRHLIESRHLVLLATHDRHLTDLADGSVAKNFHFRENLGTHGMVFDYRRYEGPAKTRNALRVLEQEQYPADVITHAYAWLEQHGDTSHGRDVPAQDSSV
ncbi:MAG: hypothetical protein AB7N71_05490 [Phycisphaerae bacterium]